MDERTKHDFARARAASALATSIALIPKIRLPNGFAYSAISSFHEGREPFITLSKKQDTRLIEKLCLSPSSIVPNAGGRFVCAVREGVWFGFVHGDNRGLCFTITFFDESLMRIAYGQKMLSWYKECDHELCLDDIGSILDLCNHVFVSGIELPSPLPPINRRDIKLMVDPGDGSWVPSNGGSA